MSSEADRKGLQTAFPAERRRRAGLAGMLVVAAGLAALLFAACGHMDGRTGRGMHGGGTDSRSDEAVEARGPITVQIRDFAFAPGNLVVAAGTEVTFVNRDDVIHTATADSGSWDTGLLGQGESAALVFEVPGEYEYRCLPHPQMRATITVSGG